MSDAMTTIVTAAVTAIVVAPLMSFTVGPRIEARNREIQARFQAREECSRQLLAMLSYCALLQSAPIPRDASSRVQAAVREERKRWRSGIDDSTRHLIDQLYGYALTFHTGMKIRENLITSAGALRAVWISDRNDDEKLALIDEIGTNLHAFYFSSLRAKIMHPQRAQKTRKDLLAKLEELGA